MTLRHSRVARVVFASLVIAACLFLMQAAARIGFSRLLTHYALGANSLAAADEAIQLTPADPDAHRARAIVLNRAHRTAEAEASLEIATRLRPLQAAQWLELGATKDELGDSAGALAAFDQAVSCAPYYGETHWQRGNLLLRLGRYDAAFADLRQAAASKRKFLPSVIDLAWSLTKGDANQTGALLQINNDNDRLEFARFLARKGQGKEMAEQLNLLAAPLSDQNREELARLAYAAGSFSEAYRLSSAGVKTGEVVNGGFEEPLSRNDAVFGWKIADSTAKPKLAIDVSQKFAGAKSLQVTFAGDWDAGASLLSQTIVVQGGQRYRLSFAVMTKELVTGGPPRILLTDVSNNQILGQSEAFSQSTNGWQQMSVEFTVPRTSEAVVIGLAREKCSSSPCPIFGVVWLDEFALQKL
jgi:tetratricopeptide (TPR) repeat protein